MRCTGTILRRISEEAETKKREVIMTYENHTLEIIKCGYCGQTGHDDGHCRKKMHFDVLQLVGLLEQIIIKPDKIDEVGISNHLRNVWGLRDALNDYFS